jgi:hypothetical protein
MAPKCNRCIKQALKAARLLTILADEGEASSTDDGCMLLYSVVRDCAYKIRTQAEREKDAHISRGWWEPAPGGDRTRQTASERSDEQ